MGISHVASTLIATAEPGSGGATVSALHDFTAARIDGLWVYTTVTGSGFVSTPDAGFPRLKTMVCPQASSGAAAADDGVVPIAFENPTPENQAYTFADYYPGQPPRFATIKAQNLTGVDMASNVLGIAVEYVKET